MRNQKQQWATLIQQCAQEQARLKAAPTFGYAEMLHMLRYTGTAASGTSNEHPPVPSESVMAPHHCAQAPPRNVKLCGSVRTHEEGVRGVLDRELGGSGRVLQLTFMYFVAIELQTWDSHCSSVPLVNTMAVLPWYGE